MKKVSHAGELGVPRLPFPNSANALVVFVVATTLLIGCGPEPDQSSNDAMTPAAAGLVGALDTDISEQDSTPMVVRRVWGGPDAGACDVTGDGRHLTFVDGEGNLAVREVGTGDTRRLTEDSDWMSQWAESCAVSPDGKKVAYSWYRDGLDHPYELRVVDWAGGNPRVLFRGETFQWYGAAAWSSDGAQILVSGLGEDESYQLALVSTL
ncbi:MAG: hypothetical protein ABIF09_01900, partial [Gemmatimonadota bacterium]